MMIDASSLQTLDLEHVWHPCSQMKDYEAFPPLVVKRAYDSYLELSDGRKLIDAISSWWCKSLGHNHPRLKKALVTQLDKFEHVILANTTSQIIVELSQQLANLLPPLNKVFYASDGSCAIEIAMKMSLQSRMIQGDKQRYRFIALQNGYHGETLGTLSVSDVGLYRSPFTPVLFESLFINHIPYVSGVNDHIWQNAEEAWSYVEKLLLPHTTTATAIILEPILQGAGGMRIYSKDFLARLVNFAKQHNIHIIADEIMTGIGRTGQMLACHHAGIVPDFLCLSKGLTSGWLPMSVVLTRNEIYDLFYDDHATGKAFLHSHTYSGNALAASVALETLKIVRQHNLCERANELQTVMLNNMLDIAEQTGKLTNVRGIGAVVAADLIDNAAHERLGYEIYRKAVDFGALLRPIGNTIYWLPPLTIKTETLVALKEITLRAIKAVL